MQMIKDVTNTLMYLKNDDGGWGELKTQTSRVTNTCEALWALATINNNYEISNSIEFIKRSINKENNFDAQNCEYARDYAWCLIAITTINSTELNYLVDICLSNIIEEYNKTDIYGFGTRNKINEFSTFTTAIVLISLIKSVQYKRDNEFDIDEHIIDVIEEIIDYSEEIRKSFGWGMNEKDNPSASYTAYMLYAFVLYHRTLRKRKNIIKKALEYIKSSNIWEISYELDSRPDNRPYRHFTIAWLMIALAELPKEEVDEDYAFEVSSRLLSLKIKNSGWASNHFDGDNMPTTWATALAGIGLFLYCKNMDCCETLARFRKGNISNKNSLIHISNLNAINKKVFIIHGHDEIVLNELKDLLKEDFNLEPIILKELPNNSQTIIEKFESVAKDCSYAIALFTPDDQVEKDGKKYLQARPNVIFEMGWFSSRLGRNKLLLILKEGTNVFSDFNGILQITYSERVSEQYRALRRELLSSGMISY